MVSGIALLPAFHKRQSPAGILISDIWFLSSGSDAAVRASLLPRIRCQRSEVRNQKRSLADPPPAFAKRPSLADLISEL